MDLLSCQNASKFYKQIYCKCLESQLVWITDAQQLLGFQIILGKFLFTMSLKYKLFVTFVW